MSPEPDERAEILFSEALRMPPGERQAFLAHACAADARLLQEVEALLADYEKAGAFLSAEAPAARELGAEFGRAPSEQPGGWIGSYKLMERLGEGGFGVVWVAEQEKPVRRRVALKIVKPGMDSREVLARFDQERQALALMDHPNIAKVFEAGATPLGRPYFVMELVRGVKITQYCDEARLSMPDRLQLFIQVCHAVQHAHQKGIIHRDLKPSNILVTLHDGIPVPKVIDFGVAKATQQQRLTDLTLYTQFEQMVGTPLYMSPEQAEMSGLDIDTRSDIYSLGVLLYELLTGRTPFDPQTLMQRGLDEIRRAVREQEPQKPSTYVSSMAADQRTNVAQRRHTDDTRLASQIRGDLDWIVMKALEKDRARRYETATGLAQDVQRHLASEPVTARPASAAYRFRKMVRRNKAAVAAGAAVLTSLVIGLGVSVWQSIEKSRALALLQVAERAERKERRKAEAEAGKSKQVAQLLQNMLQGVSPSVARGRDTMLLREILDKTAEQIGMELNDQPDVEAELRGTIGHVYQALGDREKARAMHDRALEMRRSLFGSEHPSVADSLHSLATTIGSHPERESMHREALAMRRKLLGEEHPDVARSLASVALSLVNQNKHREAETLARDALARMRKVLGNDHADVGDALGILSLSLWNQGKSVEAEKIAGEGLAIVRKVHGNEHPLVADTLIALGQSLRLQNRMDESEALYREALAIDEKLLGAGHPTVTNALSELAIFLAQQGKQAEAEVLYRRALEAARSSSVIPPEEVAYRTKELAHHLYSQNKFAEAEPLFRDVVRSRASRASADPADLAGDSASLGRLLTDWAWSDRLPDSEIQNTKPEVVERAREAERLLRECLSIWKNLPDRDPGRSAEYDGRLGGALVSLAATDPSLTAEARLAMLTEAEAILLDGHKAVMSAVGASSDYKRNSFTRLVRLYDAMNKPARADEWRRKLASFDTRISLDKQLDLLLIEGVALVFEGKLPEAEAIFREALEMLGQSAGVELTQFDLIFTARLGQTLKQQGKLLEAEAVFLNAVAMARRMHGNEHPDVAELLHLLAHVYGNQGKTQESEKLFRESIALRRRVVGEQTSEVASGLSCLAVYLINEQKFADAEALAREALAIREKVDPDRWKTFNVRSILGGSLLGQEKFNEAEPLLLSAYEGLKQREETIPAEGRIIVGKALRRLVQFYETTGKSAEAASWREKLASFERAESVAGRKAVGSTADD